MLVQAPLWAVHFSLLLACTICCSVHRMLLFLPVCATLCASIPCAISLANINQGVVTISKSLSRNGFDWERYTSDNSPPPLLLVLVFVNTVQEYQLGQVCAPTLQSPFVNSESVSVVSAWATADFRRHECGYTALGAMGAIICSGAVSQWTLVSQPA